VTTPEPTIRVTVDPTNPGQFFACCGLLELADRLWEGAEGWFADAQFYLAPVENSTSPNTSAERLLDQLARCRLTNTMTAEQWSRLTELSEMGKKKLDASPELKAEKKALDTLRREAPIMLDAPFHLVIDWFLDDAAGGSCFKTWAGQQSVLSISQGMHRPIQAGQWRDTPTSKWLTQSDFGDGLPFNFDSDLSGHGVALDAGFSFDPLGISLPTRPLIELAAFVGLQRFRPMPVEGQSNLYRYELWPIPLPPAVAAAAAATAAPHPGGRQYEFRLLYRTEYLKSFLPSQYFRGDSR
jgi:CRISPR-associated protein Csb3